MAEKSIRSRIVHKHDTEAHWLLAENFIPKQGEIIVYDIDDNYTYERFKIGDGITLVNNLSFADESTIVPSTRVTHGEDSLSDILETYILTIDYDTLLAFDTSELVFGGATNTTAILDQAILDSLILA